MPEFNEESCSRISKVVQHVERTQLHDRRPRPARTGLNISETRFVNITSTSVDGNGRYPAQLQAYDVSGDSWSDEAECRVEALTGSLNTGRIAAVRVGDDGTYPVFAAGASASVLSGGGDLTPSFSGARVYREDDAGLTAGAVHYISFQVERWDTDGYWSIGSPTRLTIPEDGYYLVGGHVQIQHDLGASAFDAEGTVGILVNRVKYIADQNIYPAISAGDAQHDADPDTSVSTLWYFEAGDYVELRVFVDDGSTSTFTLLGSDNGEVDDPSITTVGFSCDFWITRMHGTQGPQGEQGDPGEAGITGPVSSTVDAIALWADATGDSLKNSTAIVSTSGDLTLTIADAATATVSDVQTLNHTTSGTAANGFGIATSYFLETSTGALASAANVTTTWVNATHASRKARTVLTVWDDAAAREGFRVEADGSAPMIGFLGANAALRQTGDVGTALVTFGLMSGTPTFAAANLSGTVAIANGGTGQTTASAAFAALKQDATDSATGVLEIATAAEMETGTDVVRAVVPGRVQFHPSAAKVWANYDGTAGTPGSTLTGYNVSSITDNGTGDQTVVFDVDFSGTGYTFLFSGDIASGVDNVGSQVNVDTKAAGSFRAVFVNSSGTRVDYAFVNFAFYGDQ